MKKTIIMATLIAVSATVNAQSANPDEQAIRGIVSTLQKGWNEKSGKTFASSFAKVHDYIVINGMYLSGITPEVNARSHQGIFDTRYKTTDVELRLDKITFVSPTIALGYVIGATYEHGTAIPEDPTAIISMVFENKDGAWKIISFHNCPIDVSFAPEDAVKAPVPPRVMYGSWYKK
ncbi:MAG: SgcJ/EcaC family oxidoreductase [Chitinophagaceae bacterium]